MPALYEILVVFERTAIRYGLDVVFAVLSILDEMPDERLDVEASRRENVSKSVEYGFVLQVERPVSDLFDWKRPFYSKFLKLRVVFKIFRAFSALFVNFPSHQKSYFLFLRIFILPLRPVLRLRGTYFLYLRFFWIFLTNVALNRCE